MRSSLPTGTTTTVEETLPVAIGLVQSALSHVNSISPLGLSLPALVPLPYRCTVSSALGLYRDTVDSPTLRTINMGTSATVPVRPNCRVSVRQWYCRVLFRLS